MSVKAIEDTLHVAEVVAVSIIKASKAGRPLLGFVQSQDFQQAVSAALPELGQVPAEALDLTAIDDIELARYMFTTVADIVSAVKG